MGKEKMVELQPEGGEEHVVMMSSGALVEPKSELIDVDVEMDDHYLSEQEDNKTLSVSTGDMNERAKLKNAMHEMALANGYESAEDMYAQVMAKQIGQQFDLIKQGKRPTMTRSDEVLSKYLKEYAEVMGWKDMHQEIKIQSNVRKLTTKERLSR